jgi:trigger factor
LDVTINAVSDVSREAEFSLTSSELQPHFERAYKKYAPKVELKGFRKGKVPLEMIKQIYGEAIENDALDDVATETFRSTMIERNIEPLGQPTMTNMDFKRGEHFRFRVKYEVKPTITLKKYKGLSIQKLVHQVTDKDIDAEVHRLRRTNATMLGVTLVRDEEDHVITADVQELADDGMPLVGKKTKDARFSLSDETLATEIKEALKKASVGEEYRVHFEQQHGEHSHKHFIAIAVKKIEKVELPDFDDSLVKKITQDKVGTKEEFLAKLRNDLDAYWKQQSERRVQDTLVDEIVKSHDFIVPESLVNLYLDSFVDDVRNRSRSRQLPQGFDEARFRNDSKEYATYQAKWALLREQIIENEHLTVTDDEVEQLATSEAAGIGIEKDKLLKYYKSSNAATDRLLTIKVMKLLRDSADIMEKDVDEAKLA